MTLEELAKLIGMTATDKITGISHPVYGVSVYEHGEPLVMLCWKDQIGNAHAEWFIVSRMEFTETA